MKISTLENFYTLMFELRDLRRKIALSAFVGEKVEADSIDFFKKTLDLLLAIPQKDNRYILTLSGDKTLFLEFDYEIAELEKDIFFFTHTESEFYSYLSGLHKDFSKQLTEAYSKLKNISFSNFITDRDGTISNYCGRYGSSIQAAYNALFLSRFAKNCVDNSVIMTSAPIENVGMLDVVVNPEGIFIYAASKGREYFNKQGEYCHFPIKEEKQARLNILNEKLKEIIELPQYKIFSFIGSGLQFKFGQTTVAYQDISDSIPENESKEFFQLLENTVREIDPNKEFFRLEDTGKDMEIILTVEESASGKLKDFDKGDGVRFLDTDAKLNISGGACLIAGDTKSDIPMINAALEKTKDTWAVFVTDNNELEEKVNKSCPNSLFVSTPDILISTLNDLGKNK